MVGKPRPATLEVAGQNEFNANSKLIRPSALCWLSQKLGLVASLAPPGGSATGFAVFDYDVGRKWLQLLKEIAPRVTRAAVLRDPAISQGIGQPGASSQYRRQRGRGEPVDIRDAGEIERAITAFARVSNSGLIVTGSPICLVITLSSHHRRMSAFEGKADIALAAQRRNLREQRRPASHEQRLPFPLVREMIAEACHGSGAAR
jgi:hypothetical protein